MTKNSPTFISFLTIFLICHFITTTSALSPAQAPSHPNPLPSSPTSPAQSPTAVPLVQSPPAKPQRRSEPTNVTEILEKAGGFSVFIRLLRSTDVITQIENDLNASNSITILAPSNDGFSALKPGTLNTLSPQQKAQLIDFHVIPTFISLQNFQTLSNPVHTQASNTKDFPLNVITDGNSVNISTGVVNTTISGTVYSDNQLAVYRVNSVLLPLAIFAPKKAVSPAPAPAPLALKPKKGSSTASTATTGSSDSSSSSSSTTAGSGASAKPASAAAATTASGSEGPVAASDDTDTSGVVKTDHGNSVVAFGVSVAMTVFLLMNRFEQIA